MQLGRIASCVTLTGIVVCTGLKSGAQQISPRERVQQIADASSLVKKGAAAWHLRMTFQLYDLSGKPAETGTIEEWWTSPESHRLVVTSPSYNLSIPGDGDQPAKNRREGYLVGLLIKQVIDPIPHYGDFKNLRVTEAKRKFGKAELTCYDIERSDLPSSTPAPGSVPEYCVDQGQNDLRLHFDTGYFAAVRNQIGKFRGVELGLDNALSYIGLHAISGHVETLESYDPVKAPVELTHASEEPPPAVPAIVSAGKVHKKEQPVYPEAAKQRHLGGTVILTAVISKQGTISLLDVVASPDAILSEAAIAAVKNWTYEPYLINGQPTEVDTTITVNFNIR